MNAIARCKAWRFILMRFPMGAGESKSLQTQYFELVEKYHQLEIELAKFRKQPRATITRTQDQIDANQFQFINSFAANLTEWQKVTARVETLNYEHSPGAVVALWVEDKLHAISVTVRDEMNYTVHLAAANSHVINGAQDA